MKNGRDRLDAVASSGAYLVVLAGLGLTLETEHQWMFGPVMSASSKPTVAPAPTRPRGRRPCLADAALPDATAMMF
jgi:hypothetical protein